MVSIKDKEDFARRVEEAKGDPEALRLLMLEAFNAVDTDKSGFIERKEVEDVLRLFIGNLVRTAGISQNEMPEEINKEMDQQINEQVDKILEVLDNNGDQKISFEEYLKGAKYLTEIKQQMRASAAENLSSNVSNQEPKQTQISRMKSFIEQNQLGPLKSKTFISKGSKKVNFGKIELQNKLTLNGGLTGSSLKRATTVRPDLATPVILKPKQEKRKIMPAYAVKEIETQTEKEEKKYDSLDPESEEISDSEIIDDSPIISATTFGPDEPNVEKDGKAEWADGTKYEGGWQNYKLHGKGKMTFTNGYVYDGDWHNGQMHGEGSLKQPKGQEFVGSFRRGEKNGKGTMMYPNKSHYRGNFKNGKFNDSQGFFKFYKDFHTYEGGFVNNYFQGYGKESWQKEKWKYEGNFKQDRYHGQGTYFYRNGKKYIGQWENGKQSGYGKIVDDKGEIIRECQWKNGVRDTFAEDDIKEIFKGHLDSQTHDHFSEKSPGIRKLRTVNQIRTIKSTFQPKIEEPYEREIARIKGCPRPGTKIDSDSESDAENELKVEKQTTYERIAKYLKNAFDKKMQQEEIKQLIYTCMKEMRYLDCVDSLHYYWSLHDQISSCKDEEKLKELIQKNRPLLENTAPPQNNGSIL